MSRVLRAPFPWFGGKSRAADLVWRAFGNVPNYVEPFAGSLAVLLARPHTPKVETANDKDGLIANFWRATKHAPDEVARWCDWPVNEADLHARHRWLVEVAPTLLEKLIADPDWFDAKVAGWWVWGISAWIGNGWCSKPRPNLPHAGRGVHARSKMPRNARGATGVHPVVHVEGGTIVHLQRLAARLRGVRICCGDWARVVGISTLGIDDHADGMKPCGVFLDPPYDQHDDIYREDANAISANVRQWALENGDNPHLRIALCGYEGEHEMPDSWRRAAWESKGNGRNRTRERIWFSPHCLEVGGQGELFGAGEYSAAEASA